MKQIFTIALFFAGLSISMAQSLSLSIASTPLNNSDTVYIWGDTTQYSESILHIGVKNNNAKLISVGCKKSYINILPGTTNLFCWGRCLDSTEFVSNEFIEIAGGTTNETEFVAHYEAHGLLGISTIKYTFFNEINPTDSVCVIAVYESTPAGIEKTSSPVIEFSNAYPNPASSVVYFNYELKQGTSNATIIVNDLLGSNVIRQNVPINNNRMSLDVSSLNSGVYFYSLQVNGASQFTKKLIIKH